MTQPDLSKATHTVYEVSQRGRTIYRAILSVDDATAMKHGLYERQNFEALLSRHIEEIRNANHIKAEDFFWLAGMHKEAGHPHVHILFWDNGDQPRQDQIPKPQFEKMMSQLRAAFSGDLNRDEIQMAQTEQSETAKAARAAMLALFRDANPGKAISMKKLLTGDQIDGLSEKMLGLVRDMPARGSLRYAYLTPAFKAKVDSFVTECMNMPELKKQVDSYISNSRKISVLYSNGKEETEKNLDNAIGKLRKNLANEVLSGLKAVRTHIRNDVPKELSELQEFARTAVQGIVVPTDEYRQLCKLLPRERIPIGRMEGGVKGYHDQLNKIMETASNDARIRLRLQEYALHDAGITLSALQDARIVDGKQLDEAEWRQYRNLSAQLKAELKDEIVKQIDAAPDLNNQIPDGARSDEIRLFASDLLHNGYFDAAKAVDPEIDSHTEQIAEQLLKSKQATTWIRLAALEQADIDLVVKPSAHSLEGKALPDEQWDSYQESYRDAKKVLRAEITMQAREDAGWHKEAVCTGVGSMLFSMIFATAQMANQLSSQQKAQEGQKERKKRDQDKSRKKKSPEQSPEI